MKKHLRFITALLLISATGCAGDSFGSLYHEALAILNELADDMVFITDEASAQEFNKNKSRTSEGRWDALSKRAGKWAERSGADESPKVRLQLANQFVDQIDEYLAVQQRLNDQLARLKALRIAVAKENRRKALEEEGVQVDLATLFVDEVKECPRLTESLRIPEKFSMAQMVPNNPFLHARTQMPPAGPGPGGGPHKGKPGQKPGKGPMPPGIQ